MIEITYLDKGGIEHTKVMTPAEYAGWLSVWIERRGSTYPHTARTIQNRRAA